MATSPTPMICTVSLALGSTRGVAHRHIEDGWAGPVAVATAVRVAVGLRGGHVGSVKLRYKSKSQQLLEVSSPFM